jgi:hypothetical protein
VSVAQLVELLVVVQVVAGSSPVAHLPRLLLNVAPDGRAVAGYLTTFIKMESALGFLFGSW